MDSTFMTNPYAVGALIRHYPRRAHCESPVIPLFWARHFVIFQVSLVIIWVGSAVCTSLGFPKTLEEFLPAPSDLLVVVAFGTGVWVPHAILLRAYPRARRIRPYATAITGSAFFVTGMLLYDLLQEVLPQDAAMSLSWTPTYVLVTLYVALSLAAVLALALFRSDDAQDGGRVDRAI